MNIMHISQSKEIIDFCKEKHSRDTGNAKDDEDFRQSTYERQLFTLHLKYWHPPEIKPGQSEILVLELRADTE